MTNKEFLVFHKEFCDRMHETCVKKNSDYTGKASDPFFNFRIVEFFGVLTAEQGFFTRLTDKFSRLATFIKRGKLEVLDESVEDTLMDTANYCILLAGYIKSKQPSKEDLDQLVEEAQKKHGCEHKNSCFVVGETHGICQDCGAALKMEWHDCKDCKCKE